MFHDFIYKAPGRICLFGDHQDYMQLPVIACSINRFIEIRVKENKSNYFNIYKPDLNEEDKIDLNAPLHDVNQGDYLRLALKVLKRNGCIPDRGFDIEIKSNIPINAGLSSSSALTVAWIKFLTTTFGMSQEVTAELISQLAYETEVIEQNSSGGKMDQYTIGMGGLIYLDTKTDQIERLTQPFEGLVIGNSGISKDTLGTLAQLKGDALPAIAQVKSLYPSFKIEETDISDLGSYTNCVEHRLKDIFRAAIMNYSITKKARALFNQETLDRSAIGELMNEHHKILRDKLLITVPKIDDMIEATNNAGALGSKIVGSGGGGCIVALADKENEASVINSLIEAGAVEAFSVSPSTTNY